MPLIGTMGTILNGTGTATVNGIACTSAQPFSAGQTITVTGAGTFLINLFSGTAQAVSGSATVTGSPAALTPGSSGTCTTNGTAVSSATGAFNTSWPANTPITINGVGYTIASVASASALTLNATAGVQAQPVPWQVTTNLITVSGTGTIFVDVGTAGVNIALIPVGHLGKNNNVASLTGDDQLLIALYFYDFSSITSYAAGGYSLGLPLATITGQYTSSGTTITATSGAFNTNWAAGTIITLNGIPFTIASVTNGTTLVVTAMPSGTCNTAATIVTATSPLFNTSWQAGQGILINSVQYTIASVQSPTQLTLTTTAGVQTAVAWVLTQASAAAFSYYQQPTGIFQGFKEVLGVLIGNIDGYDMVFNSITNNIQAYTTGATESTGVNFSTLGGAGAPIFVYGI